MAGDPELNEQREAAYRLAQRALEVTSRARLSGEQAAKANQAGVACEQIFNNLAALLSSNADAVALKNAVDKSVEQIAEAESAVSKESRSSRPEVAGSSAAGLPGLAESVLRQPRLAASLFFIAAGFTGLFLVALWAGIRLVRTAAPESDIRVETSGALTFLAPNRHRTAWFLMSPTPGESGPWVNTGITLNAGERATLRASGRVNLAMHRMIEVADGDELPPLPWFGPAGLTAEMAGRYRARPEDPARLPHSLAPSVSYGALIGQIAEGHPALRPDAKDIIEIAGQSSIAVKKSGTLWLAVNEIYFDSTMQDAYVAGKKGRELNEKIYNWNNKIVLNHYWHVWYDDNAGSFLVTADIAPGED